MVYGKKVYSKDMIKPEEKYDYIPLVWASIRCESKMERKDLKAGESLWQNSSSTTS